MRSNALHLRAKTTQMQNQARNARSLGNDGLLLCSCSSTQHACTPRVALGSPTDRALLYHYLRTRRLLASSRVVSRWPHTPCGCLGATLFVHDLREATHSSTHISWRRRCSTCILIGLSKSAASSPTPSARHGLDRQRCSTRCTACLMRDNVEG